MSEQYLAGALWHITTMPESRRRESEESSGRLVAGWSRGWRKLLGRRPTEFKEES